MSKRVILKEKEKITAYRPANFFADQLVYARNQTLRRLMEAPASQQMRLQEAGRIGGVQFLEDTDCRDVHALGFALESVGHPLFWITGGKDAMLNYASLLPVVAEKVKAVIGIGMDNSRIISVFSPYVEVFDCRSMEQAVKTAFYSAESGDVVLLSSPCACDGRYADVQERSLRFREAVKEL